MKLLQKASLFIEGFLLALPVSVQNFCTDIVVCIDGSGDFTSLQPALHTIPIGTSVIYKKRM